MSAPELRFDGLDSRIVVRAADPATTRRRITYSIVIPLVLIALLLGAYGQDARPRSLLWVFILYVAINMFEKVGYGLAVLAYKRVIRKLVAQVTELGGSVVTE